MAARLWLPYPALAGEMAQDARRRGTPVLTPLVADDPLPTQSRPSSLKSDLFLTTSAPLLNSSLYTHFFLESCST